MNRRGFLKLLGMGAATPVLTKVVGPFSFLEDRPIYEAIAVEPQWVELPYKYAYGLVTVSGILKEVYAPAIMDQLNKDSFLIQMLKGI